ncbi:MAG TPA: ZIP family metal transporter [Verrucomicrobiota bacterium]|nr:ZIP family metal transporter [Verrucomicrobiota bacterium]HRT07826.1 ZIP family metal transporter [Candidatus Paceibacterota bacterium]HRT58235.1 ZIP family metal transporter [Candidatus Paceibacterota bacterium]
MSNGMLSAAALLLIYGVLVTFSSLAGGWALLTLRLSHARLQMAVSLVAGLMLGMALLHFLPHAAHQLPSLTHCMLWALAGFLAMFFLQRFLPFHDHDVGPAGEALPAAAHSHEHDPHPHPEPGGGGCAHAHGDPASYSWLATAIGLSLHSLTGGVALAAAVVSETHVHGGVLVGLGTALAIILHKPFDAITIVTLMAAAGCSRAARHLLNGLFALMTPLGMLLAYLGASHFVESNPAVIGAALAFCAGTFLCIACADLLPELQFHTHDRFKLSLAMLAGLAVAVLIAFAGHSHEDHGAAPAGGEAHSGEGHSHEGPNP